MEAAPRAWLKHWEDSDYQEPVCVVNQRCEVVAANAAFSGLTGGALPHLSDLTGQQSYSWEALVDETKKRALLPPLLVKTAHRRDPYLLSRLFDSAQQFVVFIFFDATQYLTQFDNEKQSVLADAFNDSPLLIVATDEAGVIRYWNRQAEAITEYSADEMVGNPVAWESLFPEDTYRRETLEHLRDQTQRVPLRAALAENWERRVVSRTGQARYLALTVRYNPGVLHQAVYWGIAEDITERVKSNEALASSEQRFRAISQATNDAIWEWYPATDTLRWNDGITKLFGWPNRDNNQLSWWEERIHPDDRQKTTESLREAMESEQEWETEYRFRRCDGTYALVYDRGITLNESGLGTHMIGGMTDISRLRLYEENLELKAKQIDEYNFFNSHRLRAPVTRLQGLMKVLELTPPDDPEIPKLWEMIRRSADELDQITREAYNLLR